MGIAASSAAGILIGGRLNLSGRQLVFSAVLAAAAWVLFFLLRADAGRLAVSEARPAGRPAAGEARRPEGAEQPSTVDVHSLPQELLAAPAHPALPAGERKRDLVGELLSADRPLTPDEAREWLDAFLVQQQS